MTAPTTVPTLSAVNPWRREISDRGYIRFSDRERVWRQVRLDRASGCWFWQGKRSNSGYPLAYKPGTRRYEFAHRLAFRAFNGPTPDDMYVCHHCDNKLCCNPDHLFLGTQDDNTKDMVRKRRQAVGNRVHGAKLNPTSVREIRALLASGVKQRDIAKRYGVAQSQIWSIASGEHWSSVQ